MKNAFLVSDEDLKSLRLEPWFIELNGPAVFLHESVLRLIQQANQPKLVPNVNGAYDTKGRSLTCDQPNCYRNLVENKFINYAARQMHRAQSHGIPGEYADKHKKFPRYPQRKAIGETRKLAAPTPIPLRPDIAGLVSKYNPESYQYMEFDAKGVCGIEGCDYKDKRIKVLHFHRSMKHSIRGINWNRKSHRAARGKGKMGRPRKVV